MTIYTKLIHGKNLVVRTDDPNVSILKMFTIFKCKNMFEIGIINDMVIA